MKSPGTWPSPISTTPSTWAASWPGPKCISHSLGLDPRELDRALLIIGKRPFKVRLDPMGYFRITLDGKDILVEHRFEDVTLKEYRAKKADAPAARNRPGRGPLGYQPRHLPGPPTARAEIALKAGREFVQE